MQKYLSEDDTEGQNKTKHYHGHICQFVQNHHKEFQLAEGRQNLPLMSPHHKF